MPSSNQHTVKSNIKHGGSLGGGSNSSSANQLRQHNKTSDMIVLHPGGGLPMEAYQYDVRSKNSHLASDKAPTGTLASAGHVGAKGQNSSQVNIQNANLGLGGGPGASNQGLAASASGTGPRIYFVSKQQVQGANYPGAHSDSANLYYNQKDGTPVAATPVQGSQIVSPALVSASCDDRSHILGQRRQQTVQEQKSRTATAPYASKKKDGAPGGHAVLENVFIQ
jgi:hypothetical protein